MNTTDTKTAALTAKQIRQQRAADRLLVIEALQGFGPRSAASLAASYTRHPFPDSGCHDIRPDEAFVLLARLGLHGAYAHNGWKGIKWDNRFLILLAHQNLSDLEGLSEATFASLVLSRKRLAA